MAEEPVDQERFHYCMYDICDSHFQIVATTFHKASRFGISRQLAETLRASPAQELRQTLSDWCLRQLAEAAPFEFLAVLPF